MPLGNKIINCKKRVVLNLADANLELKKEPF